jgi:vancomycin resistance protein YoaR
MRKAVAVAVLALFLIGFATSTAPAQQPQRPAPAAPSAPAPAPGDAGPEIKLDETTTLRAAALEARMSAVLANFALLQRQAQDLQQEMTKMLEERKKLIEDAGKKANVEVKDPNEWAFDNKGQRYVNARRVPATR